ncbi:hypothetical protein FB446DRAFT_707951 [Lentinula raphanica]|nr:hypothetical protein FB446DRAFT_707951 [Lentinula raphanica]
MYAHKLRELKTLTEVAASLSLIFDLFHLHCIQRTARLRFLIGEFLVPSPSIARSLTDRSGAGSSGFRSLGPHHVSHPFVTDVTFLSCIPFAIALPSFHHRKLALLNKFRWGHFASVSATRLWHHEPMFVGKPRLFNGFLEEKLEGFGVVEQSQTHLESYPPVLETGLGGGGALPVASLSLPSSPFSPPLSTSLQTPSHTPHSSPHITLTPGHDLLRPYSISLILIDHMLTSNGFSSMREGTTIERREGSDVNCIQLLPLGGWVVWAQFILQR